MVGGVLLVLVINLLFEKALLKAFIFLREMCAGPLVMVRMFKLAWTLGFQVFHCFAQQSIQDMLAWKQKKFKSLCLRFGRWNSQLIKQIFVPEDAKAILNLVPPRSGSNGKLQWIHSKSGMFSVKDVYRYLNCGRNGQRNQVNPSNLWKLWWKMKLPPRLLLLGWKIGCASLATKVNLRRKTVYVSDLKCLLC